MAELEIRGTGLQVKPDEVAVQLEAVALRALFPTPAVVQPRTYRSIKTAERDENAVVTYFFCPLDAMRSLQSIPAL